MLRTALSPHRLDRRAPRASPYGRDSTMHTLRTSGGKSCGRWRLQTRQEPPPSGSPKSSESTWMQCVRAATPRHANKVKKIQQTLDEATMQHAAAPAGQPSRPLVWQQPSSGPPWLPGNFTRPPPVSPPGEQVPSARSTQPEAAPAHVDPNTQSRAEPTEGRDLRRELYDDQKIAAGLYAEYRTDYELTNEARQLAFDDLNRRFDLRPGFPDEVPLAKLEEIN